ncbi:MAG: hypothetical protein Q4F65_11670 [Propionibacteriaceae bacterium]|nr:hypothetical protein [Propionibacteriaceae bacterium]
MRAAVVIAGVLALGATGAMRVRRRRRDQQVERWAAATDTLTTTTDAAAGEKP